MCNRGLPKFSSIKHKRITMNSEKIGNECHSRDLFLATQRKFPREYVYKGSIIWLCPQMKPNHLALLYTHILIPRLKTFLCIINFWTMFPVHDGMLSASIYITSICPQGISRTWWQILDIFIWAGDIALWVTDLCRLLPAFTKMTVK